MGGIGNELITRETAVNVSGLTLADNFLLRGQRDIAPKTEA